MRVLLPCGHYLHDRITLLRRNVWVHKTSLALPLLVKTVCKGNNKITNPGERSCRCARIIHHVSVSTISRLDIFNKKMGINFDTWATVPQKCFQIQSNGKYSLMNDWQICLCFKTYSNIHGVNRIKTISLVPLKSNTRRIQNLQMVCHYYIIAIYYNN